MAVTTIDTNNKLSVGAGVRASSARVYSFFIELDIDHTARMSASAWRESGHGHRRRRFERWALKSLGPRCLVARRSWQFLCPLIEVKRPLLLQCGNACF
jgi:hypothetical protein